MFTPRTGWTDISPRIAQQILEASATNNRPLKRITVYRYATDMAAGRWQENGATIVFSEDGHLLDGQHRLSAVIRAGVSIRFYVVTNVKQSTFWSIDGGIKRSASDVFAISGYTNTNRLAAVVRLLTSYDRGFSGIAGQQPTMNDLVDTFNRYGEAALNDGLLAARVTKLGRQGASLAALHVIGSISDRASGLSTTHDFFAQLSGMANSRAGDPAFALRNRFQNAVSLKQTIKAIETFACAIKAWNAHRRGVPMSRVTWRTKKNPAEPFPKLIGYPYQIQADDKE